MGLFGGKRKKRTSLAQRAEQKLDKIADGLEDFIENSAEKLDETEAYKAGQQRVRAEAERIEAQNRQLMRQQDAAAKESCPYCGSQLNAEGHCAGCGGV